MPATPIPLFVASLFPAQSMSHSTPRNDVAELIVEPGLASTHERAVVTRIAEIQAEQAVGHVLMIPSATEIAANIESSPTEQRRRHIHRGRRIDLRLGPHVSGIRGHRER